MKVLYITNHNSIAACSGGYISDYLNDLTYYGFYELFKDGVIDEIVDSTPIISLYKENQSKIPKQCLWGGMTAFWLIDGDNPNRINIQSKIENKYYDLIVYGASRRCLDYFELVKKVYDPKKIVLLDGNDDCYVHSLSDIHPYFKRECYSYHSNVFPISFSYPTCKISTPNKEKIQSYGTVIPGEKSTYIFSNETDYFKDYNNSYYGVTMKKAGWDCMRHYEIMGNYCMPYFLDIDKCPEHTLTTLPKDAIKRGNELINKDFDITKYYDIMDECFLHFKQHCTTKEMARYILNKIA
jgi:hypothetical protein